MAHAPSTVRHQRQSAFVVTKSLTSALRFDRLVVESVRSNNFI